MFHRRFDKIDCRLKDFQDRSPVHCVPNDTTPISFFYLNRVTTRYMVSLTGFKYYIIIILRPLLIGKRRRKNVYTELFFLDLLLSCFNINCFIII